jgi:anti-sigma factor RsiW
MDCNETKRLLDAYTDDELELTRMLDVEAHLAACSACNKAAEAAINFRYSVRMNTPLYKAPPKLKAKIRVALRKESKSSWIFQFRRTLFYALAGLSVVDCDITMRGPLVFVVATPAQQDGFVAQRVVVEKDEALAYLARAARYMPKSSRAAEAAIPAPAVPRMLSC